MQCLVTGYIRISYDALHERREHWPHLPVQCFSHLELDKYDSWRLKVSACVRSTTPSGVHNVLHTYASGFSPRKSGTYALLGPDKTVIMMVCGQYKLLVCSMARASTQFNTAIIPLCAGLPACQTENRLLPPCQLNCPSECSSLSF